uniref:Transmembrane protein 132C n=1 Tax=Astyanax mexicanus TaxID=7994 RepID=A0A3B1IXH7_ASTMX
MCMQLMGLLLARTPSCPYICLLLLEGLQRFGAVPTYLPVQYQVLNADLSFFLKEANQDIMRNSSLQARTELFFIQQARRVPTVNASYGPLSVQQPVPMEFLGPGLLNNPSSSSSSSSERIHPSWPKVQVLFYVVGRDWDDYSTVDRLPCVRMFAFHETQEVRGTCRLKGELGLCVAELEPLPSWFSPPSTEGTPVELYYMVQSTDSGDCNAEDSRKTGSIRSEQQGPAGYFSGPTPMRRIELRLDGNFVVMVPSRPIRQRETVSAFLAASTLSVKLKEGVAFLGARASNPVHWTVSQDVRSEGHRVVTLHCRRKDSGFSQRSVRSTEILNTAALTGRTVAIPVKVVTVGTDGAVTDVTESVECRSTDEAVVKVSERCDYVYVNGKETRGRVRMLVNFTYSYLSSQLELSVWMPHLPLQIDLSDPELSQIKGWRVPVPPSNPRPEPDDEDEAVRRDRGCGPQYQSTTVRVLTHFKAEPEEWRGQPEFLLGSDWQVDVTELVRDSLRVDDSRVAGLMNGQVLMGLNTGTNSAQHRVLTDSYLEGSIRKCSSISIHHCELTVRAQPGLSLFLSLCLSLSLLPHSERSLISAWLQFSDGSMTPLDLYDPAHLVLTATSLDERVVSVQRDSWWKWPVVVVRGEGQGLLVRVEMYGPESCQTKTKRRTVLAAGNANIRVKFGRSETEGENRAGGDRRHRPNAPYYGGSISDMETGIVNRGATTIKTAAPGRPGGDRYTARDVPADFSDFPAQADLPRGRSTDEDLLQARRGLTDLEIGMYALLGVFCLAILVFLINCVSYALKYRNKQLPLEGQETMAHHAHDWVWLGHEGELLEGHAGLCLQQEEPGGTMDSGLGLEEGSQLLNGDPLNSPTTKRKRVKFTTFSHHGKSGNGCASISPLVIGQNDIQWVCPDIELGDSKELRNYMERLNENATKSVA